MRSSMIAVLAAAGMLAASTVMAQTTMPAPSAPGTANPPMTAPMRPAPTARSDADRGDPVTGMRVSKIIGSKVHNSAGETVGAVDDLVIRSKDQVVLAVISVGGFLGIGDRKVAVPWDELTFGNDRSIVYNVTKKELETKPEFRG
ncbi:MAG: PRC-barrel domain-containing protein [Alphaproteobacteria bacterium]|nr:PRC-barrel domain-containing protein [Alphaproteobacteria bacterium]